MTASEVVYTWIEYPKDITQPCFEGSVSHILLLFCIKQKRLSQNETAFFVFAKKIGQVLTSLSQNLPVSLIFCILGNQVKISQR